MGRLDVLGRGQRLGHAFFVVGARDVALFEHLFEHEIAPRASLRRVGHRVISGGRLDDAGQQRGLGGGELLHAVLGMRTHPPTTAEMVDVLAEVRPRGGLDAVGAVAEVDRVEVLGDDLFLRPFVR